MTGNLLTTDEVDAIGRATEHLASDGQRMQVLLWAHKTRLAADVLDGVLAGLIRVDVVRGQLRFEPTDAGEAALQKGVVDTEIVGEKA